MPRWKKYRLNIRGKQFYVAVYGNQADFIAFFEHCKTCKVKCNQGIFIECVNQKEDELAVFRNLDETRGFMRDMLLF